MSGIAVITVIAVMQVCANALGRQAWVSDASGSRLKSVQSAASGFGLARLGTPPLSTARRPNKCRSALILPDYCMLCVWIGRVSSALSKAGLMSPATRTFPPRRCANCSAARLLAKAGKLPLRMGPSAVEPCT